MAAQSACVTELDTPMLAHRRFMDRKEAGKREEGHEGNEQVGGRDEGHAGQDDEGQGDEGHEKLRGAMKAMKAKKAETILAVGHSYGADDSMVMEMNPWRWRWVIREGYDKTSVH